MGREWRVRDGTSLTVHSPTHRPHEHVLANRTRSFARAPRKDSAVKLLAAASRSAGIAICQLSTMLNSNDKLLFGKLGSVVLRRPDPRGCSTYNKSKLKDGHAKPHDLKQAKE